MQRIIDALNKLRINPVNEEYDLQHEIAKALTAANISYSKEYKLGKRNRVDFLTGNAFDGTGMVIEVKKGKPNKAQVIGQLKRYAEFPEVIGIILVVEKNLDIPKMINGKPCISFGLNKRWGIAL
jgi:hypothetical protein